MGRIEKTPIVFYGNLGGGMSFNALTVQLEHLFNRDNIGNTEEGEIKNVQ